MRVSWHRLRARIRHRRFARDLAEEMAVHRAMKAAELDGAAGAAGSSRKRGLDVDRAMGNDLLMRERAREVWIPPPVDALGQDVRDAFRSALIASDARFAVRVEPLANRIRDSLVTERILAVLAGGLAGSALLLACAGLFGLLMHLVARRTREIGVRMALGARRVDVVRPVIAQALLLTIIGLAIGGSVAWSGAGVMRGVLHGITPNDPLAYVSVAVVTLFVSAAAGLVPARRAASISPVEALRAE